MINSWHPVCWESLRFKLSTCSCLTEETNDLTIQITKTKKSFVFLVINWTRCIKMKLKSHYFIHKDSTLNICCFYASVYFHCSFHVVWWLFCTILGSDERSPSWKHCEDVFHPNQLSYTLQEYVLMKTPTVLTRKQKQNKHSRHS